MYRLGILKASIIPLIHFSVFTTSVCESTSNTCSTYLTSTLLSLIYSSLRFALTSPIAFRIPEKYVISPDGAELGITAPINH